MTQLDLHLVKHIEDSLDLFFSVDIIKIFGSRFYGVVAMFRAARQFLKTCWTRQKYLRIESSKSLQQSSSPFNAHLTAKINKNRSGELPQYNVNALVLYPCGMTK